MGYLHILTCEGENCHVKGHHVHIHVKCFKGHCMQFCDYTEVKLQLHSRCLSVTSVNQSTFKQQEIFSSIYLKIKKNTTAFTASSKLVGDMFLKEVSFELNLQERVWMNSMSDLA